MNRERQRVVERCEVSRLCTFELGGIPQKVLVEGVRATNPLLVFLHGGPGSPLPFSAGMRGMHPALYERYVLVSWDQYGCGINDGPLGEGFDVARYVAMTVDLVRALKRAFPENRLCLLGTSWGSVLAAHAAAAEPELVDRVVVYGQVLRELGFNDEVRTALEAALPARLRPRLAELFGRDGHTADEALLVSRWIAKYTEGYRARAERTVVERAAVGQDAAGSPPAGAGLSTSGLVRALLGSPDYRLRDVRAAVLSNGCMRDKRLFGEVLDLDLSDTLATVRVPYLIMQGEKDIVTSMRAIRAFVEGGANDLLSFHLVRGAGHMPGGRALGELFGRLDAFTEAGAR